MRGREYDPRIGQFLQADPIVQAPFSSQHLNRYAYVINNPLKLVDPSGFDDSSADSADTAANNSYTETGQRDGSTDEHHEKQSDTFSLDRINQARGDHGQSSVGKPTGNDKNPQASSAPGFDPKSPGGDTDTGTGKSSTGIPGIEGEHNPFKNRSGRIAQIGPVPEEDDEVDPETQWEQRLEPLPESETAPALPPLPFVDELSKQLGKSEADLIREKLDTSTECRNPTPEEQLLLDKETLKEHVRKAGEDFENNGFTPGQQRALRENPWLYRLFRGERLDWFFRLNVRNDLDLLERWELTPRGQFGPDVLHLELPGVWSDLTTPGQWGAHENLYSPSFGNGGFLLEAPPVILPGD